MLRTARAVAVYGVGMAFHPSPGRPPHDRPPPSRSATVPLSPCRQSQGDVCHAPGDGDRRRVARDLDVHLTSLLALLTFGGVAAGAIAFERRRRHAAHHSVRRAVQIGDTEPPSLHPLIDPETCFGCGACVAACPEAGALQVVDGHARLVQASHCVGHGRCQAACPTDAITLVFGTAARGISVPLLGSDLQTSVPGIYVAGELGGLGLIRNATTQGVAAIEAIARELHGARDGGRDVVDVAIVGAGPAGLAAALACRERGLSHVVLDQDGVGGSVRQYPRRKLVMTAPVQLPLGLAMDFREVSKEQLVDFWDRAVRHGELDVRAPERVEMVEQHGHHFRLRGSQHSYTARRVVLATGRRGTPRKLGVAGEDLPKVLYRLLEPDEFAGRRTLVVGGGNSAVEAALSLADAGAHVILSYRGASFTRAADANQARLARGAAGLEVLTESEVTRIESRRVILQTAHGERIVDNDDVFVFIGGELPTRFLDAIGVETTMYHGEPPRPPRAAGVAA